MQKKSKIDLKMQKMQKNAKNAKNAKKCKKCKMQKMQKCKIPSSFFIEFFSLVISIEKSIYKK